MSAPQGVVRFSRAGCRQGDEFCSHGRLPTPRPGLQDRAWPVLCAQSWGHAPGLAPSKAGQRRPVPWDAQLCRRGHLGATRGGSGEPGLGKVSGCCRPLPGSSEPGRVSQPLPTVCPQMESFSHYAGRAERLRCSLQGLGARAGGCLAFCGDICSPQPLSFRRHGPWCPASG